MTSYGTDLLAALIAQKRECLARLRDLGIRQTELILEGDLTELLRVLAAKQRVIDTLQEIERDLKPFHQQEPAQRTWRSPEDRARCADHAAACQELLSQIVRQERQSESDLTRRRDEVAAQLHDAHAAGNARGAYFAQSGLKTGMLDVTSDSGGTP